jgi:hypothetical protein
MIRRPIKLIVVHCSASPNGRWNTAADIDEWHRERGFKRSGPLAATWNPKLTSIGYHFVIGTNGAIWTGRNPEEVGAHVEGRNQNSIGICMVGTDSFSAEAWDALKRVLTAMPYTLWDEKCGTLAMALASFERRGVALCGHRDIPGVTKSCPGFEVQDWIDGGGVALADHTLSADAVKVPTT